MILLCIPVSTVSQNLDVVESIVPPGVIFEALALNKDLPTPAKPKYRSPTMLTISPDGNRMYICEQTAKRITVFDVPAKKMLPDRFLLPNEVTGCAVSINGRTLFATCGSEYRPEGLVCEVDVASGKVTKRIAVGRYPRSPVLSPDGTRLFICNQFSGSVSVIDVGKHLESDTITIVREPCALDITPDGKKLVVGHLLPDDRSTDSAFISSTISIIELATRRVDTIRLPPGSKSIGGLTVSPDGRYAFTTHLTGRFMLPVISLQHGWVQSNQLAIIDLQANKLLNDVCLDLATHGNADPWTVTCSPDSQYLVVAHAGSNELSIIRFPDLIDKVVAAAVAGTDLSRDFTAISKFTTRVPVATKCPRTLAIAGSNVFTAGYFDDAAASMEELDLSAPPQFSLRTHIIGESQLQNGERNGENNIMRNSVFKSG
jgi:YVTN family beta-propeller protein